MAISDSIAKTSQKEATEIDKEEAWTDISGVGLLVQPEAVSQHIPTIWNEYLYLD